MGPYNVILPEPYEARRVLETKAHQAASGGLEIQCRASLPLLSKLPRRVSGFGGFATRPTKKEDPLFGGGKMFAARANTHPRNPPKPPLWSTGLIIAEASMAFTYTDSDSRHRACSAIVSENRL